MRRLLTVAAWVAFSLGVSAQALQPAPTAVDLLRFGPAVGQRVPGFTLPDQNGRTRDLASILGPNGAMLVFFRSADW